MVGNSKNCRKFTKIVGNLMERGENFEKIVGNSQKLGEIMKKSLEI